jgi:hypothetical protein
MISGHHLELGVDAGGTMRLIARRGWGWPVQILVRVDSMDSSPSRKVD